MNIAGFDDLVVPRRDVYEGIRCVRRIVERIGF